MAETRAKVNSKHDIDGGTDKEPNKSTSIEPVDPNQTTSNNNKNAIYRCEVENCGKTFTRKYGLTRHSEMHVDSESIICDICYKEITDGEKLDSHIDLNHKGSQYICVCENTSVFESLTTLRNHKESCYKHLQSMQTRKPYVCQHCERTFTRKDSLMYHLQRQHPDRTADDYQPRYKVAKVNTEVKQRRSKRTCRQVKKDAIKQVVDKNVSNNVFEQKSEESVVAIPPGSATKLDTKLLDKKSEKEGVDHEKPVRIKSARTLLKTKSATAESLPDTNSGKSLLKTESTNRLPQNNPKSFTNTSQESKSVGIDGFREKLEKMENIDVVATSTEELEILADLKNACDRLSCLGKDILVISAEEAHCRWFGSSVTTKFVQENHRIIYNFFKYCQDARKEKVNADNTCDTELQKNTDVMVKVEVDKDAAANEPADNDDDDTDMLDDSYDDINGEDTDDYVVEPDIDDTEGENGENEKHKPAIRLKLKLKYDGKKGSNPTVDFERAIGKKKKEDWLVVMKEAKVGNYMCSKCGNRFVHEEHFKTHQKKRPNCDSSEFKVHVSNRDILTENITYKDPESGLEVTSTIRDMIYTQVAPPYICLFCESTFPSERKLQRHAISHVKINLFECYICGQRYKLVDCLRSHLQKTHFRKPYECATCYRCFTTMEKMTTHSEKYCQHLARANMVEDTDNDKEVSDLVCDVCGYKAGNKSMLIAHHSSHDSLKQYICMMCERAYSTMSGLERHLVCMHHDKKPFQCSVCDKQFKEMSSFRRHEKLHGEKAYPCEVCGRKFGEKGYLTNHMRTHTGVKPYVCDFCGEKYRKKIFFDNHRRLHTGERPYKCDEEGCDKTFRCPPSLKQHKRTHCKVGSFICDICGRRFKQPGQLNHHRKNHTIEWRWPCTYCKEKFKSCWRYKNHLAKCHPEMKAEIEKTTNIRLHECPQCHKVYHDPEDLRRHVNNHLGIKPFKCVHCDKAFSDKSNMNAHMHIHTGKKKLHCAICYKTFIHKKNLLAHVKKVHNGESRNDPLMEVHIEEIPVQDLPPELQKIDTEDNNSLFGNWN